MIKQFFQNTNLVVKTGFTSMLVLVLLYGVFSLYQLRELTFRVTSTIAADSRKIMHLVNMRDAIRQREVVLNKMLASRDFFYREQIRMEFFRLSGQFRQHRSLLQQLPLTQTEKVLLENISKQVNPAQKLYRQATDLLLEQKEVDAAKKLIDDARVYQSRFYFQLNELINLQDHHIQDFVKISRKQYETTLLLSFLFGIVIILLAWLISRITARIITQKNNQLLENNRQLEQVSQQALAATRTKSEFLAVMSHEIRTPLTSIIGFAEALRDGTSKSQDREKITRSIIKNGKHLLKIINDILDISKIEANRMEFEKTAFSPVALLHDIEEVFKPQFAEKGIQFDIEYVFPLPNVIENDELRIRQIIMNLCSNALKFTDKGRVVIRTYCDISREMMYFTVVDSGIGLSQEQMDKIFDAFTQADSSTTREYGGTGLGLSLSKQFAEKMGGTITVESLQGIGSQFTVSISTGEIEQHKLITGSPELPEKSGSIKYSPDYSYQVQGRILVVEDNIDNRQLLSILLEETGATLSFAENGQEAVDKALYQHHDLILMDMQMPVMGGLEATRILRDKNYTRPIVALTANAMKSDYDACIQAGCNDFLTKPINREKLLQLIYKYLPIREKNTIVETEASRKKSRKMEQLIRRFENSLLPRIEALTEMSEQAAWQEMRDEIHKIKGVGTSMGYPDITALAIELDYEIMKHNKDNVQCLLKDMQALAEKCKR